MDKDDILLNRLLDSQSEVKVPSGLIAKIQAKAKHAPQYFPPQISFKSNLTSSLEWLFSLFTIPKPLTVCAFTLVLGMLSYNTLFTPINYNDYQEEDSILFYEGGLL